MNFGPWELLIILAIVALLFGTKKLGTLGTDIGNAIKGLRTAMKDDDPGKAEPAGGDKHVTDGSATENDKPS